MFTNKRALCLSIFAGSCALLFSFRVDAALPEARDTARDAGRERPERRAREPSESHFWSDAGIGYGWVNLSSFVFDEPTLRAGVVSASGGGPAVHLGIGPRFGPVALGLRAGMVALQGDSTAAVGNGQLWTIDLEGLFRMPLGRVEPYLLLGGGYAKFGGLGDALSGIGRGADIDGVDLRGGVGVDWYATPRFSIGARGSVEMLFVSGEIPLRDVAATREQVQKFQTIEEARAVAQRAQGASTGTVYMLTIGPGFHF